MIRVVAQSGKYYGIEVDITSDHEIENINIFTGEGTPVILVQALSDLDNLGIDEDDVEMIQGD